MIKLIRSGIIILLVVHLQSLVVLMHVLDDELLRHAMRYKPKPGDMNKLFGRSVEIRVPDKR